MASFAIVVTADPTTANGPHHSALAFCEAALDGGHDVTQVFFYNAAVSIALSDSANGQSEIAEKWRSLATRAHVAMTVCVTAAERRELSESNVADAFVLAGLGQLADAAINADRTLTFNG